jgi:hypothetical protein
LSKFASWNSKLKKIATRPKKERRGTSFQGDVLEGFDIINRGISKEN